MQKIQKPRKNTILQLMEILSEKSDDSQLSEEFWNDNKAEADELAGRLGLTPVQAVLLAVCLQHGPRNIDFNDISRHLDISNIRALSYSSDINALIRARYLKYRDAKDQDSFDIPGSVVLAFRKDEVPEAPVRTGLDIYALFDAMGELLEDLNDDAITTDEARDELKRLFDDNGQLSFVRELKATGIKPCSDRWTVLVMLCHLLVNKDDNSITYGQLSDAFGTKSSFNSAKSEMRAGTYSLMKEGWMEQECEDGQVNASRVRLTAHARRTLLSEFKLKEGDAAPAELVKPESFTKKELFYTECNAAQVEELCSFLEQDRYTEIRTRMKETGFRSGFACLFYGAPGTGKTETVNQLARRTGRYVLPVNVPDIKSKWVGESEKNIKDVFDRYRVLVSRMEKAPILLFNEADAIIGIRREGATSAVDKMENSIQNIILQEMETLDGIMIATTNLTQNLDPAFERRFLYKICFERPDAAVRQKIWHTMLPGLSEAECAALAAAYDLSGGQMENVARKYSINAILHGAEKPSMDVLHAYCSAERLENQTHRRIGF